MAKRFTDSKKWQKQWFRELPDKAKLAWIYICDTCDTCGILEPDYGLATFQLGFKFNNQNLSEWFENKLFFINEKTILIVPFFEFQYGDCKDSWSAKIRAKSKLEKLGFEIKDNKIIIPHCGGTVGLPETTGLIRDIIIIKDNININNTKTNFDFEYLYQLYPLKKGKAKGLERCAAEIKTQKDYDDRVFAINAYKADIVRNKTDPKFIKHFSTFMNCWRDWLDPEVGTTDIPKPKTEYEKMHEMAKQIDGIGA